VLPKLSPVDRAFARYCRTGSPRALAAVYDRAAVELARIARHLAADAHEAEDLLQETFLVAIEQRRRYDPARAVVPWLLGILANLARRRRVARRRSAAAVAARAPAAAPDGDPLAHAMRDELGASVRTEVRALPEPYRSVLVAHLERGLPAHAIAAERGCPPSTVRNQLMRGLDHLRRALPAGLAATAAAGLSASALAGVRADLLRRAALGPPAHVALTGTSLGILAMKKILLTAAVLCASALALWIARDAAAPAPLAEISSDTTTGIASAPDAPARAPDATAREAAHPAERVAVPEAPAATRGALEVRVTFARDGTPAAGVGLYLRAADGDEPGIETRTDAQGVARFDDLAPGAFVLVPDRVEPQQVSVEAGARRAVELAIPRGVDVEGRVVDVAGKPAGGARVFSKRRLHHDLFQLAATANADGTFFLRDATPGTDLVARADGYQPSYHLRGRVGGAAGTTQRVTLRLGARAWHLFGRVIDASGAPVPHARLVIAVDEDARKQVDGVLSPKYASELERPLDLEETVLRCDELGRFESFEVPMGEALLVARPPRRDDPRVAWAKVAVRPHTDNETTLRLAAGAALHGTVVDREGRGYAGLPVLVEWKGTMELGCFEHHLGHLVSDGVATTDEHGAFSVTGLLPGPHEIFVGARFDDALRIDDDDALLRETVTLAAQEERRWRGVVERRQSLRVRAVGPGGEALAGWAVRALESAGGSGERIGRHRTDAEGRCRIDLLPIAPLVVSLHAPLDGGFDEIPACQHDVRPSPGEVEIRLRALPSARLRGRLVGAVGVDGPLLIHEASQTGRRVQVDAAGAFACTGLGAGEYSIEAQVGQEGLPRVRFGPWRVEHEAELDTGDLAIPIGRRALLQVVGPDGATVTDCRADMVPVERGSGSHARTAGTERCRETPQGLRSGLLAPGPHVAFVVADGYAPAAVPLEIPSDADVVVPVQMSRGVRVTLEAIAEQPLDRPALGVDVFMIANDATHLVLHGDRGGSFVEGDPRRARLDLDLGPGRYRLRATAKGGDSAGGNALTLSGQTPVFEVTATAASPVMTVTLRP
jgi:RNA polymerase sigma-70 factor (ECF subfamily)